MTDDSSDRIDDVTPLRTAFDRRTFIAAGGGLGATLLAGCTSNGDGTDDGDSGGSETGQFRLLVKDAPADIDDFERLDVTLDSARVFEGTDESEEDDETDDGDGESETNESDGDGGDGQQSNGDPTEDHQQNETDTPPEGTATADEEETETEESETETDENETETSEEETPEAEETEEAGDEVDTEETEAEDESDRGFYVLELDDKTVDLTEVVDGKVDTVFDGELSAGTYRKLELHVSDVEGIVDGEEAAVKVPSGKLQLTKPFEIEADGAVDYVFDIHVVRRGQDLSYNLKPVISGSGVVGEDVDADEIDVQNDEDDEDGEGDGADEDADREDETDEDGEGTPEDEAGTPTDDDTDDDATPTDDGKDADATPTADGSE